MEEMFISTSSYCSRFAKESTLYSCLEDKGDVVDFIDRKVVLWDKNSNNEN